MKSRQRTPPKPEPVLIEHAGKWLAWSEDGMRILVVADTLEACKQAALAAGYDLQRVAFDKVPRGRFRGFELGGGT